MTEHTPLPWATDGTYIVARFGPTIADCSKSPSMPWPERRANVAFIIKAVNNHDMLVKALRDVMDASNDPYEVARNALATLAPVGPQVKP
jgi:hypothetical protein